MRGYELRAATEADVPQIAAIYAREVAEGSAVGARTAGCDRDAERFPRPRSRVSVPAATGDKHPRLRLCGTLSAAAWLSLRGSQTWSTSPPMRAERASADRSLAALIDACAERGYRQMVR
jgi:hypothetical protein